MPRVNESGSQEKKDVQTMADDDSAGNAVSVPRFLLAAFASIVVLAISGVAVRVITLVVDVNGFGIRMAHLEQVVAGNSVKLYQPRWSAINQRDYETQHQQEHREARNEHRTDVSSLRSECFASIRETQRRLEVHDTAGAHVRADERLSKLEKDMIALRKKHDRDTK